VFCVALLGYPVIYSVVLSFRHATVDTFVSGRMSFNGLDNYRSVVLDSTFWKALSNTVAFTLFSLGFQFAVGFILALFFQETFRLKNLCISLLLLPLIVPVLTSANIFKALFSEGGPVNSVYRLLGMATRSWLGDPSAALTAITVTNVWIGFPFHFLMIYAGISSIPADILEAAKLDGAPYWQTVFQITVPMIRPAIIGILTLGTIYTVKVFDLVWIMTGGGPANSTQLLSTYAYQEGFTMLNFGKAAAIASIIVLLIGINYLFRLLLQRGRS
jgi:multiple sugar transport system permease protein